MPVKVCCPHCGWEGEANAEDLGRPADCPQCNRDFILRQKSAASSGGTPYAVHTQAELNPRVSLDDIPERVREILGKDEVLLYAARPAHSTLVLSMVVSGIVWGVIGLFIFLVGVLLTLPLGLVITYYSWKNRYYIITPERTIVSQGIFNVGIRILFNRHIQLISINTGLIDRWLGLNTVEVSTAAQSGMAGMIPGLAAGAVQLKSVNVKDVIGCYDALRKTP